MGSDQPHEVGLAGRYATAIFELADEQHCIETVEQDLATLRSLIAGNPDLARLVRSPVFSREDHARAMKAVMAATGAAKLTSDFVQLLAAKRRLFYLTDIIRAFERLRANERGEVRAEVTSARSLTEAETRELRAVLKGRLGREPLLETKVDPSLLGGLVVKVGSRMIDSSLRTKLTGIRAAMRGH